MGIAISDIKSERDCAICQNRAILIRTAALTNHYCPAAFEICHCWLALPLELH
jgi:hypothetical protein